MGCVKYTSRMFFVEIRLRPFLALVGNDVVLAWHGRVVAVVVVG